MTKVKAPTRKRRLSKKQRQVIEEAFEEIFGEEPQVELGEFYLIDERGNIIKHVRNTRSFTETDMRRWNYRYYKARGSRVFPLTWIKGKAAAKKVQFYRKKSLKKMGMDHGGHDIYARGDQP